MVHEFAHWIPDFEVDEDDSESGESEESDDDVSSEETLDFQKEKEEKSHSDDDFDVEMEQHKDNIDVPLKDNSNIEPDFNNHQVKNQQKENDGALSKTGQNPDQLMNTHGKNSNNNDASEQLSSTKSNLPGFIDYANEIKKTKEASTNIETDINNHQVYSDMFNLMPVIEETGGKKQRKENDGPVCKSWQNPDEGMNTHGEKSDNNDASEQQSSSKSNLPGFTDYANEIKKTKEASTGKKRNKVGVSIDSLCSRQSKFSDLDIERIKLLGKIFGLGMRQNLKDVKLLSKRNRVSNGLQ